MIEQAYTFGPSGALSGVMTEPEPARARREAPAVLLWNVGIHHHIGPHRVNVDLARSLSEAGLTSLRFDLGGMGDSEVRPGEGGLDLERAVSDVHDAMTLLEKRRQKASFVVIGFCSSVDAAHALAVRDERVKGACFLEGYAFRTRGFDRRRLLRLLELERWRRWIANHRRDRPQLAARALGRPEDELPAAAESIYTRVYPPAEQLRADYEALVRRDVRLLFLFAGRGTDFNHVGQFDEMLGTRKLRAAKQVEVEYYPEADHTFFRVADRERVVERVSSWAKRQFAA